METYDSLKFFRGLMLLLNLAICGYLTAIYALTPYRAARQAEGLRFAQSLSALPGEPWTLALAAAGLAALLLLRAINQHRPERRHLAGAVYVLEPLFCMLVILALHLGCNGLILLAVVDLIDGLHGRARAVFLGVMKAYLPMDGIAMKTLFTVGSLLPAVGIAILLEQVATKPVDLLTFLFGFTLAACMGLNLIAASVVGGFFAVINYRIKVLSMQKAAPVAAGGAPLDDDDEEEI